MALKRSVHALSIPDQGDRLSIIVMDATAPAIAHRDDGPAFQAFRERILVLDRDDFVPCHFTPLPASRSDRG
jgi:hypothetical protein